MATAAVGRPETTIVKLVTDSSHIGWGENFSCISCLHYQTLAVNENVSAERGTTTMQRRIIAKRSPPVTERTVTV